jgi:membrane protein implicated in regulation of membrane protease activity
MTPFLFFLILGVALITIELLVLGLSAFWFLFIGFGALIAALYTFFVGDNAWLSGTVIFVFSSIIISLGLYKPLKKWQSTKNELPSHDAIGQTVETLAWNEESQSGKVLWSGTEWNAVGDAKKDEIKLGDAVKIASVNGIQLTVEKA